MEFLFEFIFELYLELMMFVVPEEKATSKKYRTFVILVAMAVLLGVIALFIWGCVLLERNNYLGFIPILIAIVISIAQIVAGFVLYKKRNRK